MATKILFNDGSEADLNNGLAVPFDRFASWTPGLNPIGQSDTGLGTGITYFFGFRDDYIASFELPFLRPAAHAVALRLKRHLETGGSASVVTGDSAANIYTVRLAPGTQVSLEFSDSRRVECTLRLSVKNVSAVAMVCLY